MIDLRIPSMTCGHCVQTVTETVQRVDAGARVTVDLPAQRVQIESTLPPQRFAEALADEGYAPA